MRGMSNLDFWERVIGLFIAFIAAAGGPIGYLFGKRQRNAEASKVEADAGVGISSARKLDAETLRVVSDVYQNVISELRKELTETNTRLDKLEEESREKDGRIERLEKENRELKWHVTQLEQQLDQKEDKT